MRNYDLSSGEYWIKLEEGNKATSYIFPKWEGTYSDNLETSSDNPSDYEPWKIIKGQDGQSQKVHRAWKMPDGTFTKEYPNENLLNARLVYPSSNNTAAYPISNETLVENGKQFTRTRRVNPTSQPGIFSIFTTIDIKGFSASLAGKRVGISNIVRASSPVNMMLMARYISAGTNSIFPNEADQRVDVRTFWKQVTFVIESFPSNVDSVRFNPLSIINPVPDLANFYLDMRDWKIEILDEGEEPTIFTTQPAADPENAYPKYEGMYVDFNEEGSNNEDDYKPWLLIRGENGAPGQPAQEVFSGYLTNEAIVLPADPSGNVTSFTGANGTFNTFLGQTQLSSGVTYSLESQSGITATINSTTGAYSVSAMTNTTELGVAIFKAVYGQVTIKKQVIVTKSKQGTTGSQGVGLINTVITYQAGTSGTTAPTGTWSSTIPTVSPSQFLWTRTVWTFSDNTTKTGYSIGKIGETGGQGPTGATGNGIASTSINYAASTSGTTIPTSGWTAAIPTVPAGQFLWTRTRFTYTNGNTNDGYAVAKQGEKGDATGITVSATEPASASRFIGMLWRNTGTNGYIKDGTYRWNGSAWELYIFVAANISVDNLAAITGKIGEIYNEYTRTYNDNTSAVGTISIKQAEIRNAGVIRNSSGVATQWYDTIFSHQLISMTRYSGSTVGDLSGDVLASAGLTFDTLSLMSKDTGFSGVLTAEMLYDTGWINLPLLKGSGQIRVRKFMKRYLIQFADYKWDASGPNQPADAICVLPTANNPRRNQLFNVKVWSIDPQRMDAFQLNEDGRLYKLSNNSQTLYYRNTVEVFD